VNLRLLGSILATSRYSLAFGLALIVVTPIISVTSNILVPSTLEINPGAEPLDMLLVGAIAGLIAINSAVLLHNFDMKAGINKGGPAGALVAFFTTACPVCQPVWLVWLGLGSATAFLAEFGRYISIMSIALLGVSLHYSLKSASGVCEVKIHGKNA
jgi:hypothetical protein